MKYLSNEIGDLNPQKISKVGRKVARKLTIYKKNLLENLLPKFNLSSDKLNNVVFKKIWCEIGFGYGEKIIENSKNNPDILHIGIDFFLNGIANLLFNIEIEKSENIMIWPNYAEAFLENINDDFIDKLFILFPNPWPKKRHHKRRIINQDFLNLLSAKMKNKAILIIATDHKQYGNYILNQFYINKNYDWKEPKLKDYFNFGNNWVMTKYQEKSLSGNEKHLFLNYINNKIIK